MKMNNVISAIIVAAGRSTRMGDVDKMFALVAGRPLLHHTVDAFVSSGVFQNVVVVVAEHRLKKASDVLFEFLPNLYIPMRYHQYLSLLSQNH